MYANKKTIDRRIDVKSYFKYLGALNDEQTIYLAEVNQGKQLKSAKKIESKTKMIIKVIQLFGDPNNAQMAQEAIIKKLYSSPIYFSKPEFYDFKENKLILCSKIQPISLQTMIWAHRKQETNFQPAMVRNFAIRLFQYIAKIKPNDLFHQNLKPSNIFYEQNEEGQESWILGEAAIQTNYRSKYYCKIILQNVSKNTSLKIDPVEIDFYSLGVILIEMITLLPIETIDKTLKKTGSFTSLESMSAVEKHYGRQLFHVIKNLIGLTKDNSLNKAVQQYKNLQLEFNREDQLHYQPYQWNQNNLHDFLDKELITTIQGQIKNYIAKKDLSSKDIFDIMQKYDPQLSYGFSGFLEMEKFLKEFQIQIYDKDEMLFLAFYFTINSQVKYFKIIQRIIPPKEIIQTIFVKAIENYDNFKDFFQTLTQGRDFWKVNQIKQFLDTLDVFYSEKQIAQIVKVWTGNSQKNSIKYDELYRVFKPILGMSMTQSSFKKAKTEHSNEQQNQDLLFVLTELSKKQPNLVSFFRKFDLKCKWVVDSKIQKTIKGYVKASEQVFKCAFTEMWEKGSIPGEMSKQLNYIYLLRNMKIYDDLELFRLILVQKINQSDKEALFSQYQEDGKGWTVHSLMKFNQNQKLEFDQRQMRSFFEPMDRDGSGYIDIHELLYKLTGLKQFDLEKIVHDIKQALKKTSSNLFQQFLALDPRAKLSLSSPKQLSKVMENIGIQISKDHCQTLFKKFEKKYKFEYLIFLRYFQEVHKIFLKIVKFIIKEYYKDNFDKFYQIGLKEGRKKWNRKSLTILNDDLVIGFKEDELNQIWKLMDSHHEESLTKEQVGQFFAFKVQATEELGRKTLDSIKDFQKDQQNNKEENTSKKILTSKRDTIEYDQNAFLTNVKKVKISNLLFELFTASQSFSGKIQVDKFVGVIQFLKIKSTRPQIMSVMSRYKITSEKRVIYLNYINFLFFLAQEIHQEVEKQEEEKGEILIFLIKEIKKAKKITNQQLFQMGDKADQMKSSDFQEMLKNITQVELYFDDIEPIWLSWGNPKYLTLKNFDEFLKTNQYKPELDEKKIDNKKKHSDYESRDQRSKGKQKMKEFVNDSEGSDTPYLKQVSSRDEKQTSRFKQKQKANNRFSFGSNKKDDLNQRKDRKDSYDYTKQRKQSKEYDRRRKDSNEYQRKERRDSNQYQRNQRKDSNDYNQNSKKEKDSKTYLSNDKSPNQKRISIEEKVDYQSKNKISKAKLDESQKQEVEIKFNKQDLLKKLTDKIEDKGAEYLNELFNKNNTIEMKRFISCLTFNYEFKQPEAKQLASILSNFGQIKLDNIKKYLKAKSPSNKKDGNYNRNQQNEQSPYKKGQTSKESPKKRDEKGQRLVDHRKERMNAPLMKEHIKILVGSFSKRFNLDELESYFFDRGDYISRSQFVKKCFGVNSQISSNMYQKIFTFLKPNSKDQISILSFKLNFQTNENIEFDESYLPEDLEKELRSIFDKADADKSGFIQPNEIEGLLSSLGLNQTQKEIQNYFARIDTNFDGKIQFKEFKIFIEDFILPQISTFEEEVDEFYKLLKMNDFFQTGCLSIVTLHGVIERFGVKLNQNQMLVLTKNLSNNDEINIKQFLRAVKEPNNPTFSAPFKSILYKIRLKKRIYLKDVQKIFQNISSSFVMAYTAQIIKKNMLTPSSCYEPQIHECGLIYKDYEYKDIRKVNNTSLETFLVSQPKANDLIVEIQMKQAYGIPIPQNANIKSQILKRYVNLTFFDMSAEQSKHAICQIQAQWDQDTEDLWRFDKNNRSVFVKIANYQSRKYQKYVIIFEFIVGINDNSRYLQVSCGSASVSVKQLQVIDSKTSKKLKLIAGIPNKSKQIDKTSVSKRTGWKSIIGSSQIDSELQIQMIHQSKFKDHASLLAALPPICILNRKAINYIFTFREYFAEKSLGSQGQINSHFAYDFKVKTFLMTLNINQLYEEIIIFWKEKIETRIKNIREAKTVLNVLLQELNLIVYSKQFQLLPSFPSFPTITSKSLHSSRLKMINEVFENIENWVKSGVGSGFKRKKNYGYSYEPFEISERQLGKEHQAIIESIYKMAVK